jgi:hypothetical protein
MVDKKREIAVGTAGFVTGAALGYLAKAAAKPEEVVTPPVGVKVEIDEEKLAQAIARELTRIRLSINFLELFTTLIHLGKGEAYSGVVVIPMPANYTYRFTYPIPAGKVLLIAEATFYTDVDHALEFRYWFDGKLKWEDLDMIKGNYPEPINFFRLGSLLPIYDNFKVEIVNKTTSTVYWTTCWKYGLFDRDIYDLVIKKYFETIMGEVSR